MTQGENHNYEWMPHAITVENTYQTNELVAVQSATIGSAPVRYDTSPEQIEHPKNGTTVAVNLPINGNSSTLTVEPIATKSEELCRDYLNGRCVREGCKFKHDTTLRDSIRSKLCKDYQNAKCLRTKCKYLHLTEAEYEEYKKTGIMPVRPDTESVDSKIPDMCRDFLKGLCGRGSKCKYSHTMNRNIGVGLGTVSITLGKRPYSALSGSILTLPGALVNPIELNEQLKHKLIELRKQVLELTQLNDALYNENMKLRKQTPGNSTSERTSLLEAPVLDNGVEK